MQNKKLNFDICGEDCDACAKFACKNFSAVTVLTKRKVSTKYVPPDMVAIKMMIEKQEKNKDIETMSDEELEVLKKELFQELNEE